MTDEIVAKKFDLSRAAVARIAKKNGAERVGKGAVDALTDLAERYIGEITKKAVGAAEHAGRKMIRETDVAFVTAGKE